MARTRYTAEGSSIRARDLPAAALRAVLREGYGRADFKADLLAGVVVGIVALPLAMALAIGVGVPPQHGLYTAIVAGALVAALGGSRTQVTGPTAAFIVILAPIYTKFGLAGLLISGAMGGVVLIITGLARLGQFIEFIPHPVTTGFTAGIATVIATLQIKDLLGLQLGRNPEHFFDRLWAMWQARGTASWAELAVAAVTFALLRLLPRWVKRVPAPLIALPVAALLAAALGHFLPGHAVATIATRFHATVGDHLVAGVPPLPPLPMLPWHAAGPGGAPFQLSFDTLQALVSGALAVAMLGGIESLLSAVIADGMAGTRHDPDSELLALGIANVITPFLGGIPATGAIALLYLVGFVLSFFKIGIPYIHESGLVGIGFSVFVVVIAALNLVLDFDFIEQGAQQGVPKYMEWYAGFGLLVTLVWLYLEILRLLAKLASRRD